MNQKVILEAIIESDYKVHFSISKLSIPTCLVVCFVDTIVVDTIVVDTTPYANTQFFFFR